LFHIYGVLNYKRKCFCIPFDGTGSWNVRADVREYLRINEATKVCFLFVFAKEIARNTIETGLCSLIVVGFPSGSQNSCKFAENAH